MRVELKSLQPNPFRNFKVDPIDPEVIKSLKTSIKENPAGFWGGIIARKTKNNGIQLAFGHHRVRAAIEAGIRECDGEIKIVPDISDADMIRMYANENATQRGNSGTAIAGTVASAIRFLLKGLFTGNLRENSLRSKKSMEVTLGQAGTDRGIGYDIILELLDGIPGINVGTVKQQLANLKASGDYDEIVATVKAEIEEENKEALKELKRQEDEQRKAAEEQVLADRRAKEAEERRKEAAKAERAAKEEQAKKRAAKEQADAELAAKRAEEEKKLAAKRKAEADNALKEFDALRKGRNAMNNAAGVQRDITFDFEGVAKYLKNASHIDTFRNIVTGEGLKPYLPVPKQAALAKQLVDSLGGAELSSRYIRENVMAMAMNVRSTERKFNAEDKAALLRNDWKAKAKNYQEEFARGARTMLAAAMALAHHDKKRPDGVTLLVTSEFRHAVTKAEEALKLIRKVI